MEINIEAVGKITKCMEKVNIYVQMEINTLENLLKTKLEKVEDKFVEDKMHGKGEYLWADGNKYVGEYVEG